MGHQWLGGFGRRFREKMRIAGVLHGLQWEVIT